MTNDERLATTKYSTAEYWSHRYRNGDHPWDLGKETAVFRTLRSTHPVFLRHNQERLSVLVPGCGFGHDALAFAAAGCDVTAVDFAPEPLLYLEQQARLLNVPLVVVERDVFTLADDFSSSFDRVIEYTCYCALETTRREEYVRLLSRVTKPGGYVIGLFFPIDDLITDGPPFRVVEDEIRVQFEDSGFVLTSSEMARDSHPARAGRERLMIFKRTN